MIPIVKAEDIITGRARGSERYVMAIEKHIDSIKKSIETSKDGLIRVKIVDISMEMGPEFAKRTPMVIYRHIKSILFDNNIIVELGTHKDGDKLLIMGLATKIDKLRGPGITLEEDEESGKEEGKKEGENIEEDKKEGEDIEEGKKEGEDIEEGKIEK